MKITKTKLALLIAVAVMMFTAPFFSAFADDSEEEKEVKAPEAVLAAFHKSYPSAKIIKVLIETKDNVAYYEIESRDNSTRRDLLYFNDGKVFEIEEQIKVDALPAKVLAGIKTRYPKGTINEAEKVIRHGSIVEYGVILEDGEKEIELLLTSEGMIKAQESVSDIDEVSDSSDNDDKEAGETDEADED